MREKTTQKKMLRVLAGESVWPPPIWLMRQAGRYLPDYRAIRRQIGSFLDMCLTPDIATEITLQPIRRFGFDAAIIFADILLVPYGLGQPLMFSEGVGPRLPPLLESGVTLNITALPERLAPVFQALRQVRSALPPETTLIGFAGAPWTVACYMICGESGSEFASARKLLYQQPATFAQILHTLTEATICYLKHQIDAGIDVIQLFDSWAGLVPPAWWSMCIFEPTARIVQALKQYAPHIPIIGFPKGLGQGLAPYLQATSVTCLGVDWTTSLPDVRRTLPNLPLQGNIDPLMLVAGGETLERSLEAIRNHLQNTPYIFNLGHGIVPETPIEHVQKLIDQIRSW